ncbi:hypothetical protein K493DRAFT_318156 [Basidiobolus meristosporus CBS 931.73]|uniref:SH3 domain-containing protein n=1 Tax=Basidiobolus meristosporus CBS 931.73 TaxID=1314790 RepID=A0A1Y1XWL6_9FUNG|nr:hypothetical protein K493DRAFT_318156 [Basidiobolus meristosporus CBS 931.73]|eukprot:ORX90157.1 hypothetical protein K493DRAFT_318156 [Basidiobolus meristosporus CBS 931.73]
MSPTRKKPYLSTRTSSLLILFSIYTLPCLAQSNQVVLDFSSLSQLEITGQFNGISTYSPNGNVSTLDPNVDSLIRKTKNTLELIGYTSVGGKIHSLCSMPSTKGGGGADPQAYIYVGGNFTHIGGVEVNNIALYDPSTKSFSPLIKGLDGPVYDMYCDPSRNIVYVGGAFVAPVPVNPLDKYSLLTTFGGSIAKWTNGNWTAFNFKGFNGPVYTIGASSASSSLFFGGSFNSTADGIQNMAPNTQEVNFNNASISGGNSASTSGFSNPRNVICGGNTDAINNIWLMRDNMPGYWWAQFPVTITPSLLRIKNTNYEGRGTKTFRLLSFPDNLIIPLTYYDPITQQTVACSSECPLNHDPNLPFQEFRIVQGSRPFTVSGINLEILSWYGAGGGLGKIQLYQSEIVTHAIKELNYPSCSPASLSTNSGVSLTGIWESQAQVDSSKEVLSYTIRNSRDNKSSVTYTPFIPESGYYEIWASIPGCFENECDNRVPVDFTLTLTKSAKQPVTNTIAQNSTFDTIVPLYMGYPKVVMTVSKNSKINAGNVLVADAIQFVKMNSLYNLNGVVEYFPDSAPQSLPANSVVKSIVPTNTTVFIGGDFQGASEPRFANIVKYNRKALVPGPVNSMTLINGELIVGGDFDGLVGNSSLPIRNIGRYNILREQWLPVVKLVPAGSEALQIIGDFNVIYGNNTPSNPDRFSSGFTSWNFTANSWVNPAYVAGRSRSPTPHVDGFYLAAPGFITLDSKGAFQQLGIGPESGAENTIVNCGAYYTADDRSQNSSYSIIGGRFHSSGVQNLAIFDQGVWKGIGAGVGGEVYSLHVAEHQLFIGGLSNNTSTPPFKGFSIWDFKANSLTDVPSLGSSSSRDPKDDGPIKVNAIRQRHGTTSIIVSGWFKRAGSLECNNICLWDMKDKQWTSLSSGVEGEITDMIVSGSDIIAGYLAHYDFEKSTWKRIEPKGEDTLPGAALSIIQDTRQNDKEECYMRKWDGAKFSPLPTGPLPSSKIARMSIVPTKSIASESEPSTGSALLVKFGNEWIPFLSAFTKSTLTFSAKNNLPLPLVLLVSVACSLGLVFFILKKRRAAKYPYPNALYAKKPLMHDNGVITSMASTGSRAMSQASQNEHHALGPGTSAALHNSTSPTLDASIMSEDKMAAGADAGTVITPDRYQVYYAKFPFNAREHGELEFQAGDKIYVIDNTDDIWWMGIIDHGDGAQLSQGVFPASYVVDRPSSMTAAWTTMDETGM